MTIPSENYRNDYPGDGSNDTFSYTFKITSESDIKVSQRDTDDVETELTLNVDYTVTGVGALNGGSIVLTAGNLTADYQLTIRRDSDLTQLTDVRNQGDFYPEVHEDTFDHLASVDLTQQSEIDRSVKVSETYPDVSVELPGPQAGKVLKWNDAGTALINVDTGDAQIAVPADDSVTPAKIQSGLPFVFPETLVLKRGADVVSASALPVINDGNYVDVTGSTDIESIDSIGVGTWLLVQFDAALNLNHSAVNLFLCAGGANILTAAGDHALFVEYGIGTWRCVSYIKANGQPIVLSGITFTNPVLAAATLNTSVAGTAFQDDDTFASAAANKFASSESIKAYIDSLLGGDGADGAFSSSTSANIEAGVYHYTTFDVNSGHTLTLANGKTVIIYAKTSITIDGEINADGLGSSGGAGGAGGSTASPGNVGNSGSAGLSASSGGSGGAGASNAGDSGGAGVLGSSCDYIQETGGGNAGAAGSGSGGNGGNGGVGSASAVDRTSFTDRRYGAGGPGGGGGAGGTTGSGGNGGAGGAGGGNVILISPAITINASGVISADGDNGSVGATGGASDRGSGGGGAGGSGGHIFVITKSLTNNGIITVVGGSGGAGGADPGSGGAGGSGGSGGVGLVELVDS